MLLAFYLDMRDTLPLMVHDTYKAAFKKAKLDFVLAQKELGETNRRKAELETRVASLRETVIALGRICGEEFDEADALGLTEAIRQTFMASPNLVMTAQNVRDRLEALGFNVAKYGNALASIHTVITRLQRKGDIGETQPSETRPLIDGSIVSRWTRFPASICLAKVPRWRKAFRPSLRSWTPGRSAPEPS